MPLCFEISLCFDKSSCSKILLRFEIPSCFKILPRRPKILCGGLNEILRREILRGEFYLSNFISLARRRACIDQASMEFCLAKFEREILKFHVAVIGGILCRNSIAKTRFKRAFWRSTIPILSSNMEAILV